MSSLPFPGTNNSEDCGPQLDVLERVLEEAWDKLEQFQNKKRSNLIFYGVRGETRETQADLVQKVGKYVGHGLYVSVSRYHPSFAALSISRRM